MVKTMLRTTWREIRRSLGRYVAIFAIVALGVGFFAGLRMSQPSMMATGVEYLETYRLHDYQLVSTLGFTEEDVAYFAALPEVETARGAVYTEFLTLTEEGDEVVFKGHSLTDGIDIPDLSAGTLPTAPDQCLGDAAYFTEADLGKKVAVSPNNDEDTLDLLAYDAYTLVGLMSSPAYLNFERGTASIGSGSVAAFVYIPEEGFDFEAYYELYLTLSDPGEPYSDAYEDRLDALQEEMERRTQERGDLRYDTLHFDAMRAIREGQEQVEEGWLTYRREQAEVRKELLDAQQELTDGEQEYLDGIADYEQGKLDYADGVKEYEDGLIEIADAEQELSDGWVEYYEGEAEARAELADAYQKLLDGEQEYLGGKEAYEDGLKELEESEAELLEGEAELLDARQQLDDAAAELSAAEDQMDGAAAELSAARAQLDAAKAQLDAGEASYQQVNTLYQSTDIMAQQMGMDAGTLVGALGADPTSPLYTQVDAALQAQGSSAAELVGGWQAAESQLGTSLNETTLTGLRTQLDQGQAEYQAGLTQYETGRAAYEDGLEQYQNGQRAFEDGMESYREGLRELEDAREQLEEGRRELEDALVELQDARRELNEGWLDYYEGEAEAQQELDKAFRELTDGEVELAEAREELADAERELSDAKRELDEGPREIADARQELDDGWTEYHDGVAEAEEEFADAEAELMDAQVEIADAYDELADLERPDTYVLTRSENTGYASFENDTAIIDAISVVFPVFFFLVAALVCMTTMTRMVDEQRTQIGVWKALGYSNGQIIGKFLFYSGSAALLGSLVGYAIFCYGMPWVIWEIYDLMYGFAPLKFVFDPLLAAVSIAAALVCAMGATYASCRAELRRPAAELIRPKAPKAGQRVFLEHIGPLWRRLSFLYKVSVRNVLRYRSRLIMMVLGIGGCTALLATGYGIRDSIASVADDQYTEITLYEYAVAFREAQTAENAAAYLAEQGRPAEDGCLVHSGSIDVVAPQGTKSVYLVVASTGDLEGFVSLHSGEAPIPYPKAGEVVLTVGLAENLGLQAGDTLALRDTDLGTMEVTLSGIADNHVFNYVFVSAETFASQLGHVPEYQTLYVRAQEGEDPYAGGARLAEGEEVSNVTVNQATRDRVNSMLSRLDYIVIVVVVCAAALAFIVLYNLTNININERIREIATIKVLGFYQNEVADYVFREIAMLSVLGSLVGLLLGKALHAFVMAQVQVDGMYFPVRITPLSYAISFGLTLLFATIITFGMRPRLQKVDMAESLKSIE